MILVKCSLLRKGRRPEEDGHDGAEGSIGSVGYGDTSAWLRESTAKA